MGYYKNFCIDFIESYNDKYVRNMNKEEFNNNLSDDEKYKYICYLEDSLENVLDELISLTKETEGGAYL